MRGTCQKTYPQPQRAVGFVIFSAITSDGIGANGKGSKQFLPLSSVRCDRRVMLRCTARRLGKSGTRFGTNVATEVVSDISALDPARYNRALINTVQRFDGNEYYTCVRLMCIGQRIIHTIVRARDAREGSPSVHSRDTPLNSDLLITLQKALVDDLAESYTSLATKLFEAAGPGFLSYDLLVETETRKIYVCEAGFKFFDSTIANHLLPLRPKLPFHEALFHIEAYAEKASSAFVAAIGDVVD